MQTAAWVFCLLLALWSAQAQACGHCVEDKIAAVYDHAVISKARAQSHPVAFFAIDGKLVPSESLRRDIENLTRSADGVDKESVRVSLELASLSFSFDPRRGSAPAIQRSIEKKLAGKNLSLLELKVMEPAAPLPSSTKK